MVDIIRTADVRGEVPRIEGTRVAVLDGYELVVDGGHDPADVADQLDLSRAAVYTALAYYYEHPDEMETVRAGREADEEALESKSLSPPGELIE